MRSQQNRTIERQIKQPFVALCFEMIYKGPSRVMDQLVNHASGVMLIDRFRIVSDVAPRARHACSTLHTTMGIRYDTVYNVR
jgi:hypothetical protein